MLSNLNSDSSSIQSNHQSGELHSTTFKRPPTPELVQDLSVKKRANSGETSDGSGSESSKRLASPVCLAHSQMDITKGQLSPDKPLDLTASSAGNQKSMH